MGELLVTSSGVIGRSVKPRTTAALFAVISVIALCAVSIPSAMSALREVTIPNVSRFSVIAAYERLHQASLLVSIPTGAQLGYVPLYPIRITPRPGTQVPAKTVVTLRLGCRCNASSIPPLQKRTPAYRVPEFIGKSAQSAYRWIKGKRLALEFSLGPLHRGNARDFLANFRIVTQNPPARTQLRFSTAKGIITPLRIHAVAQFSR